MEGDPIHSTVYRLTLNGWSNRIQEVPHIAHHFRSTRDKLTIENVVLLKRDSVHTPELYERMLSDLHNNQKHREEYTPVLNHHLLAQNSCGHCQLC